MKTMTEKKFEVDLLRGPILKAMLVFAVPLFFSGVFQQLYNTMDTVIIGHTLGGALILRPFLELLHTPVQIMEQAYAYISTITVFIGVMFAYNLCAGLLRAIGNSVMPLVFLILSSLLNIVLDFFFITKLSMGVQGAAVATVIAQCVYVLACLVYIGKKADILIPKRTHFIWDRELYQEMLAQGFSMAVMSSIVHAGSAVLQSGINSLGYLVIAGHVAARKLFMFLMMPYMAVSQTVSTFVAQNYGAGQMGRIRRAVRYSYLCGAVLTALISLVTIPLAPVMVRLLSGSSEAVVIENGALYLQVVAPCLMILALLNPTQIGRASCRERV